MHVLFRSPSPGLYRRWDRIVVRPAGALVRMHKHQAAPRRLVGRIDARPRRTVRSPGGARTRDMQRRPWIALVASVATSLFAVSPVASVEPPPDAVSTYEYTKNLHPLGHSARNVPLQNATPGASV